MAAKFHPISPAVWTPRLRKLPPDTFRLLVYVWTAPARVSEGLFRLPLGYISADTALTEEQIRTGLNVLRAEGYAYYDADAEVILDPHALSAMGYRNGDNRIKAAIRRLGELPPTPLVGEFLALAAEHAPELATAFENQNQQQGASKGLQSPSQGTEVEVEVEDEIEDGFEKFWNLYPCRNGKAIGKTEAATAWKGLGPDQRERAMIAVRNYADACKRGMTKARDGGGFFKDDFFEEWQTPAVPDNREPREYYMVAS